MPSFQLTWTITWWKSRWYHGNNLQESNSFLNGNALHWKHLQEHILFPNGSQGYKQGATKSKKRQQKYHTEATHVAVNNPGKCFSVQTSGPKKKKKK